MRLRLRRKDSTSGPLSCLGRLTWVCFAPLLLFTLKISSASRSHYSTLMQIINSSSINQNTRSCVSFGDCEEDAICPTISYSSKSATFRFSSSEALHKMTDLDFNQCATHCNTSSITNTRSKLQVGKKLPWIDDLSETGCHKVQYDNESSYACCFWLRTWYRDENFRKIAMKRLSPSYNESLRTLSLTGKQKLKPVVICLNGMYLQTPPCCIENEQTGFFECSNHHTTSCNRENSGTFACTFKDIPPGNHSIQYGVIPDLECIKEECEFKSQGLVLPLKPEDETSLKKTEESSILTDSILLVALVTFILVLLCLVIGFCYLHHKVRLNQTSMPPASSEGDTNFPEFILKKGILLVYLPDCQGFRNAMGILSQILGNALHCNVYDIFDSKYGSEVHQEGAFIWLAQKMRSVDKVVIIETDISHIIQYTTARFIHTSSVEEGLHNFYQRIDTFLLEPLINCKLYFVRLDKFSPNVGQISSLMNSFQPNGIDPALRPPTENPSYTLPQSMRRLLADLTVGVPDGEPCSAADQSTIQAKNETMQSVLINLASYKANNSVYHTNIVMSES